MKEIQNIDAIKMHYYENKLLNQDICNFYDTLLKKLYRH